MNLYEKEIKAQYGRERYLHWMKKLEENRYKKVYHSDDVDEIIDGE